MAWKTELARSYRSAEQVSSILRLTEEETEQIREITKRFPMLITPYYLSLVNPDDPDDPIKKMCLPQGMEFSEGGEFDTSGEHDNTVVPGLQHKYRQTALILSTNQCAMYCRHCFRKRLVGVSNEEIAKQLPVMAGYVKEHKEINNVLISGGDSFLNSNEIIERYLSYFADIPHIEFIRFGTRTPVVLPQRIYADEELTDILRRYTEKKQIFIVTQYNHPREVTAESIKAVKALQKAGCVVRNQTVLLKGINDKAETLGMLMNELVRYGIIPYYVFQCRPVIGVLNQFQVPLMKGIEIVENAKAYMSGQAKSLNYVMSHPRGKIEIVGVDPDDGKMIFKFHQAKYEKDNSRIFKLKLDEGQCWLDANLP